MFWADAMEGRTLLINKGLPYWSVSFCIPIYEIYVALFLPAPRLRLLILSDFFLVGSLFSLAPFFALFAQNNNLYEMSKKREAFGVNIPKQNCLKTAFDMRDSCCCFWSGGFSSLGKTEMLEFLNKFDAVLMFEFFWFK